jgi:hypothetical protein
VIHSIFPDSATLADVPSDEDMPPLADGSASSSEDEISDTAPASLALARDGGSCHIVGSHDGRQVQPGDVVATWWNETGEARKGYPTTGWLTGRVKSLEKPNTPDRWVVKWDIDATTTWTDLTPKDYGTDRSLDQRWVWQRTDTTHSTTTGTPTTSQTRHHLLSVTPPTSNASETGTSTVHNFGSSTTLTNNDTHSVATSPAPREGDESWHNSNSNSSDASETSDTSASPPPPQPPRTHRACPQNTPCGCPTSHNRIPWTCPHTHKNGVPCPHHSTPFLNHKQLRDHMQSHRYNPDDLPWFQGHWPEAHWCDKCGAPFDTRAGMRKHQNAATKCKRASRLLPNRAYPPGPADNSDPEVAAERFIITTAMELHAAKYKPSDFHKSNYRQGNPRRKGASYQRTLSRLAMSKVVDNMRQATSAHGSESEEAYVATNLFFIYIRQMNAVNATGSTNFNYAEIQKRTEAFFNNDFSYCDRSIPSGPPQPRVIHEGPASTQKVRAKMKRHTKFGELSRAVQACNSTSYPLNANPERLPKIMTMYNTTPTPADRQPLPEPSDGPPPPPPSSPPPDTPSWCHTGARVIYNQRHPAPARQTVVTVLQVHPPMPGDDTTFVEVRHVDDGSVRETMLERLQPMGAATPDSGHNTDPMTTADRTNDGVDGRTRVTPGTVTPTPPPPPMEKPLTARQKGKRRATHTPAATADLTLVSTSQITHGANVADLWSADKVTAGVDGAGPDSPPTSQPHLPTQHGESNQNTPTVDPQYARRREQPPPVRQPTNHEVENAFRSIDRGAAYGNDGISRECLEYHSNPGTRRMLITLTTANNIHPDHADWICGGRATGMSKPKDAHGIRPITVSSLLARWTAITALAIERRNVTRHLGKYQTAVNTKSGAEVTVLLTRLWLERNVDDAVLLSDIQNGYGSVRRKVVGERIREHLPGLTNTWSFLYGDRTNKVVITLPDGTKTTLDMSDGLLQGCPFAAFAFVLTGVHSRTTVNAAYDPTHTPGRATNPLDRKALMVEYIDDQTFLGDPTDLVEMFIQATTIDKENGKLPSLKKIIVASANRTTLAHPAWDTLERFVNSHLVPAPPLGEPSAPPFTLPRQYLGEDVAPQEQATTNGIVQLGAAFGCTAFTKAHVQGKIDAAVRTVKAISIAPLQDRLQLLRFCAVSKVDYCARTNPPAACHEALEEFDQTLVGQSGVLWEWLGTSAPESEEAKTAVVCLQASNTNGGIGIRSARRLAEYAYEASVGDSVRTVLGAHVGMREMLVETVLENGGQLDAVGRISREPTIPPSAPHELPLSTPTALVVHHILADLNATYNTPAPLGSSDEGPDSDAPAAPDPPPAPPKTAPWPSNVSEFLNALEFYHNPHFNDGETAQRRAGRHINQRVLQQHIDHNVNDEMQTIRMLSQAQRGAGRCTATTSTDDNTSLTDAEFRFAVLDRIGLPPLPQIRRFLGTETCPFCPSGAVPITPSHVAKCMGLAGRLNTHDKIVATLLHMCKDLLPHATIYSDKQLINMFPSIGLQHPDMMIEWGDGRPATIVDFTTAEYDSSNVEPLGAARAGERRKDKHMPYVRMAAAENINYIGISMEPSGAPGPNFQSFLSTIYAAAKREDPGSPEDGISALGDFTTNPHVNRAQYTPNWILPNRYAYWLTALDAAMCKGRWRAQQGYVREYYKIQAAAPLDGQAHQRLDCDGSASIARMRQRRHIAARTPQPASTPTTIMVQNWFAANHPTGSTATADANNVTAATHSTHHINVDAVHTAVSAPSEPSTLTQPHTDLATSTSSGNSGTPAPSHPSHIASTATSLIGPAFAQTNNDNQTPGSPSDIVANRSHMPSSNNPTTTHNALSTSTLTTNPASTVVDNQTPGLPTALDSNHLHLVSNIPPFHPTHPLPYLNSHDSTTASPQALDDALGSAPLLSTATPESNVNLP